VLKMLLKCPKHSETIKNCHFRRNNGNVIQEGKAYTTTTHYKV